MTTTPSPPSPRNPRRSWLVTIVLSILIVAIIFNLEHRNYLNSLDLLSYDLLVAARPKEPPSSIILNIDFDEDSVRHYNAFPIGRLLLADVIGKINSGKPSVIGVDIILDLARLKEDDEHLAKVIDDAGNVVLVSEFGFGNHQINVPLSIFQKAAAGVAFGDLPIDQDGTVRRMFLRVTTSDYKSFSLPVALADLYSDKHLHPGGEGYLMFGQTKLPLATTHPDTAWIDFRPSAPTRVISVDQLLSTGFDISVFHDKIVLIGQSSEMGKDTFVTPVTHADVTVAGRDVLSGSEIHAAAVASLLSGNFFRSTPLPPRAVAGFFLALLVIALAMRYRWHTALITATLLGIALFFVASLFFSHVHLWMPFISLELCLFTAMPAGLGYRSVEERRLKNLMEAERRQLMGLFERYVSADVAAEIWKNRDSIVLAGEERVATIMFSDIRSFTAITAGVPSQQVLAWLNRYLTEMGDVIKKNRGFLNKFIGDGLMIVFGAPLSDGPQEDARRAVQCAVEMLARIDKWNAVKAPGDPSIKIGIGIHTGMVTSGNVGSPERLEYSVIGETVNLASRLEALTKDFKTSLVISPATYEYVRQHFSTVSLGEAQVRGFTGAIQLYSVELSKPIEVHS